MAEEEVLKAVENARYKQQNTKYIEEIDAEIDEGMVDLVNYFNHTVGHPTEYCCSGLIQDHYDVDMLERVDLSDGSYKLYEDLVILPYITFEPIYHTWTGENTIIDGDFHTFRESIPHGVDIFVTTDGFGTTHAHKHLDFKFSHKLSHKANLKDSNSHKYNYTCHLGSSNCLPSVMELLQADIELYDRMLEQILEMFQIKHSYPSSIFMFTKLKVDRDTRELQWTLSNLQGYPADIQEDTSLEVGVSGEFDGKEIWRITGSLDKITEHICNNDKYIEVMPSEHPFQNASF